MHKWAMFVLFIAASVLGLSVIIFAPPTSGDVMPEAKDNEIQFIMTDFAFDKDEYRVKAGETVILTMLNKTGTHGVLIAGTDINLTTHGESIEVTFDEPGEYDLFCSIMCGIGHNDMVAKLIVEAPDADSADEDTEDAA